MQKNTKSSHVAMLCTPGAGHLIPFVELANRLIVQHRFTVTLVTFSDAANHPISDSLPDNIRFVSFPSPPDHLLPDCPHVETRIVLNVTHNLPRLRDLFNSLAAANNHPSALVVDIFATDAFDVAEEFGVSPYIFWTTTCTVLCVGLHLPKLDVMFPGKLADVTQPLQVPGCRPIDARLLPLAFQDKGSKGYAETLRVLKRYKEAKGILSNTFEKLESEVLSALREDAGIPPVYPVGPLIRRGSDGEHESLKWLDKQPQGSVLYVSFGSGGTLTNEQMKELAWGLQLSGHRFLWVVRSPNEDKPHSAYFGGISDSSKKDPLEFLYQGMAAGSTRDLGLVVSGWAPQVEVVLGHPAVGGFLSHCGWNSTLESIVNGVPMAAWPLYAEQKMNAVMLVEDVKVALRVEANERGVVEREQISRVIKRLMEGDEGKELRSRVQELSFAAKRAWDEDGASFKSMGDVANERKNL